MRVCVCVLSHFIIFYLKTMSWSSEASKPCKRLGVSVAVFAAAAVAVTGATGTTGRTFDTVLEASSALAKSASFLSISACFICSSFFFLTILRRVKSSLSSSSSSL